MSIQIVSEVLGIDGLALVVAFVAIGFVVRTVEGRIQEARTATAVVGLGLSTIILTLNSIASAGFVGGGPKVLAFYLTTVVASTTVAVWVGAGITLAGYERYIRPAAVVLSLEPIGVAILSLTNPFHHLLYDYAGLLVGAVLLIVACRRLERPAFVGVLVAAVVPLVGNVVFLIGVVDVDPTPLCFAVSTALLGFAVRDLARETDPGRDHAKPKTKVVR